MTTPRFAPSAWSALGAYALAHAAVDAACAVMLWSAFHDGRLSAASAWSIFLIYNCLAFAVQPLIGLAADRLGAGRPDAGRWTAVAGGLLTAAALPLAAAPHGMVPATVLAGLGNASFHIGGGIVSLRAAPGRATPVGLFVAPGAAGLLLGVLAGKAGLAVWPFAAALIALIVVIALAPTPRLPAGAAGRLGRPEQPGASAAADFGAIVVLLLLAIGVRSYVGMALAFPWKSQMALLTSLTAAVVAGKALGGVLGDRFGWRPVAVLALLASLPLLALGGASPAAGIAGALVFNMTMPVTLAGTAVTLAEGREGFAFGLTCLALFAGAAPSLIGWVGAWSAPALFTTGCLAALALWVGLGRLLEQSRPRAPYETAAPAAERSSS